MKVLDLQCENAHSFEGWFGSEADFVSQKERSLVQCPLCASAVISKKLSAPRLNLASARGERQEATVPTQTATQMPASASARSAGDSVQFGGPAALTELWMEVARSIVAHTEDVGERFAEEVRRMHYGEIEERAIRGNTSPQEKQALLEEGIEVVPLLLPEALKNTLQ